MSFGDSTSHSKTFHAVSFSLLPNLNYHGDQNKFLIVRLAESYTISEHYCIERANTNLSLKTWTYIISSSSFHEILQELWQELRAFQLTKLLQKA